jgi:hypothetical protein
MIQLEQRMYTINNMYFLGIQAGIQALHAVARYGFKYADQEDYIRWVTKDETVIVTVGGFSNEEMMKIDPQDLMWGMNYALHQLETNGIRHAAFYEKMANNCLSSIAVLANEKVWPYNNAKYPDSPTWNRETTAVDRKIYYMEELGLTKEEAFLREFLKPYQLAK